MGIRLRLRPCKIRRLRCFSAEGRPERVRFAPSPTGFLHLGGLRTALYNFLLARQTNGQFILRIEDTDQSRTVPGAVSSLLATLQWAGLSFDEGPGKATHLGPYIQSERLEVYRRHAEHLLQSGKAYRCFCSRERLEALRGRDGFGSYDGHCRNLSSVLRESHRDTPFVVRFRVPAGGGDVAFRDVVFGRQRLSNAVAGDAVLLKSDGFPTYHFANVVDDHLMQITTVLRGQEWLPSTPLHLFLYDAFGWRPPRFAHLPLLLNKDRSKLSKRNHDAHVDHYRQQGYLPIALLNFVALLGWAPRANRELMNLQEMIEQFDVQRINHADAIVDIDKLNWANRQHFSLLVAQQHQLSSLVVALRATLPERQRHLSDEFLARCLTLMARRVTLLSEISHLAPYLFERPIYHQDLLEEASKLGILAAYNGRPFEDIEFTSVQRIGDAIRAISEASRIPLREALKVLRFALTGSRMGAPVADTMYCLGKSESLARISLFSESLGQFPPPNK